MAMLVRIMQITVLPEMPWQAQARYGGLSRENAPLAQRVYATKSCLASDRLLARLSRGRAVGYGLPAGVIDPSSRFVLESGGATIRAAVTGNVRSARGRISPGRSIAI